MRDTWFKIRQIMALVLFVIAFSLMGMMTGRPLMSLLYGGVLLVVMAITYILINRRRQPSEVNTKTQKLVRMIIGTILGLLSLATPLYLVKYTSVINLPGDITIVTMLILLAITLVFILLMAAAVHMINELGSNTMYRSLGFVVVFITSVIPGILMSTVDKTASSIGAVYYVALAVLILSYSSIGLILKKN